MNKHTANYDAVTKAAAKLGYTPTEQAGFYQCQGITVDLSATHEDWVAVCIVNNLHNHIKEN